MSFELRVNGEDHSLDLDGQVPLLSAVRNYLGLFGTKYGCGVGKCGACIVHLDGAEKHSCQITLGELDGEEITTIEGFVRDNPDHPLLQAWLELEVPQCGFCQPGMIMNAASLLAASEDPDAAAIAAQMDDICRCGTYPRAVRALAKAIDDMKNDKTPEMSIEAALKTVSDNAADPVYEGRRPAAFSPNPWVAINHDETISIYSPPAEMGQGSLMTLAVIYAEELDADWSKVRIEHSPSVDADFGNPVFWAHGIMLTVGSSTIANYYDPVRRLGAQARQVLLDAAADHWDVPVGELTTEPSVVIHAGSGRRLGYAEIASFATKPDALPDLETIALKDPADFRLIGQTQVPRDDIWPKIDGTALYSMDVDLPNMTFARVLQAPVKGAKVVAINDEAARQLPGIVDIIELPTGVGIVAENYEMAFFGGEMVEVEWSETAGDNFDSAVELEVQAARAQDLTDEGTALQDDGDAPATLAAADTVHDAVYTTDFMYQAHLETLNAAAQFTDGGRLEMWVGTQAPTHLLRSMADAMEMTEDNVILHRTYLGGGFGRRAAQDQDWVIETAQLARALGRPVKMIRSREDDTRFGRFKPITAQYLRASQTNGTIDGYHHRVVSDEPLSNSDPWRYEKNGFYPSPRPLVSNPTTTFPTSKPRSSNTTYRCGSHQCAALEARSTNSPASRSWTNSQPLPMSTRSSSDSRISQIPTVATSSRRWPLWRIGPTRQAAILACPISRSTKSMSPRSPRSTHLGQMGLFGHATSGPPSTSGWSSLPTTPSPKPKVP